MKRLSKVQIAWSSNLAYVIGVIATDGNLSPNGRTVNITSKDLEMIENIKACLHVNNKIGRKGSGSTLGKPYYVLQIGDINFYIFLEKIGLTKAKSKTISSLQIPQKYFFDFLRGCIDGDGNISVVKHPESKIPQLRLRLCSASKPFLTWIKETIEIKLKIKTGWIYSNSKSMHVLSYGKIDSIKILKNMYYSKVEYYLDRKYQISMPFIK